MGKVLLLNWSIHCLSYIHALSFVVCVYIYTHTGKCINIVSVIHTILLAVMKFLSLLILANMTTLDLVGSEYQTLKTCKLLLRLIPKTVTLQPGWELKFTCDLPAYSSTSFHKWIIWRYVDVLTVPLSIHSRCSPSSKLVSIGIWWISFSKRVLNRLKS